MAMPAVKDSEIQMLVSKAVHFMNVNRHKISEYDSHLLNSDIQLVMRLCDEEKAPDQRHFKDLCKGGPKTSCICDLYNCIVFQLKHLNRFYNHSPDWSSM